MMFSDTFPPSDDPCAGVLSARAVAEAVAHRRASAAHVLEYCLSNIADRNLELNAIVALRTAEARDEAARIDRDLTVDHPVGPLAGVPFTVKDLIATSALPTTAGSRVLRDYRPGNDATAVARLREAGGVLIGKGNCPEFAFSIDTRNELFGRTRNPLGDFSPGGSSGGDASALASGMSALGVGTDFGGSIRWPAQCVGITGLRPTVGRIPTTGIVPAIRDDGPPNARSFQGRIQTIGPLARSVGDLELALEVMCGPDGIDELAVDAPLGRSGDLELAGVEARFGYSVGSEEVHPEVAAAIDFAVAALREAGSTVSASLPEELAEGTVVYSRLRATDRHQEIARVSEGRRDELTPFIRELLATSAANPPEAVEPLWEARGRLLYKLLSWLDGDRVLLLPVATRPPLPDSQAMRLAGPSQFDLMAPSRAISLFGLPALSVPCTSTADGRPISTQVVGPPFREDLVLAVGSCIEEARIRKAGE